LYLDAFAAQHFDGEEILRSIWLLLKHKIVMVTKFTKYLDNFIWMLLQHKILMAKQFE
jgi:hypothetical protein